MERPLRGRFEFRRHWRLFESALALFSGNVTDYLNHLDAQAARAQDGPIGS